MKRGANGFDPAGFSIRDFGKALGIGDTSAHWLLTGLRLIGLVERRKRRGGKGLSWIYSLTAQKMEAKRRLARYRDRMALQENKNVV